MEFPTPDERRRCRRAAQCRWPPARRHRPSVGQLRPGSRELGGASNPSRPSPREGAALDGPHQPHALSYLPDILAGLVTLGEHPEADGEVRHPPVSPALTGADWSERTAAIAGRPVKPSRVTRPMLIALGLFMPILSKLRETLYQWVLAAGESRQAFRLVGSWFAAVGVVRPSACDPHPLSGNEVRRQGRVYDRSAGETIGARSGHERARSCRRIRHFGRRYRRCHVRPRPPACWTRCSIFHNLEGPSPSDGTRTEGSARLDTLGSTERPTARRRSLDRGQ